MAQSSILRNEDRRTGNSARREIFERDLSVYLEAIWKTALWLTMRRSLAEALVIKTMTRAYHEWQDPIDSVNGKARLFRILTREFFGFGNRKHSSGLRLFLSESIKVTAGSQGRSPQNTISTIEHTQLSLLTGISGVSVKGAIARLKPHSRLMLILLYRERFSYSDIAYITDLPMDSVKTILTRLRRLIPGYILENAGCLKETADSQPALGAYGGESDRDRKNVSLKLPSTCPRENPACAAAESWENEGGAVVSQGRG